MPRTSLTRRQLTSGMLTAGAALLGARTAARGRGASSPRPAPRKVPPGERIRVAIFGCRNRGWQVADSLAKSGRFDVATLCDPDDAMFAVAMKHLDKSLPGTPRFEKDFRRALDDPAIDAVVIAVPDHWHALMTVLALDAGKHVYVEKPASYNIDDGKAMVAARRRHPQLVAVVGTQQRSGQHFHDARALIAEGGLGKVGFCRGWATFRRSRIKRVPDSDPPATLDYDMWVGPAPMRPYNGQRVHYNWHFVKEYGTGDMANWGAHYLDSIRDLMGLDLPTAVTATSGKVTDDAKEWPDTMTVLYEYPDLTVLWELRTWTHQGVSGRRTGASIHGDKGTLVIDRGGWELFPKEGEARKFPGSSLQEAHALNFADAVTRGVAPSADLVEGHKSAILCHLANISAEVSRRLAFDPETQTIRDDPEASRHTGRPYRKPWRMPATV